MGIILNCVCEFLQLHPAVEEVFLELFFSEMVEWVSRLFHERFVVLHLRGIAVDVPVFFVLFPPGIVVHWFRLGSSLRFFSFTAFEKNEIGTHLLVGSTHLGVGLKLFLRKELGNLIQNPSVIHAGQLWDLKESVVLDSDGGHFVAVVWGF